MSVKKGPRVLLYDIETAPLLGYVWGLWDNNVSLNQIHKDWHILSWSAKWLGDPPEKIMYMDQRNAKDIEDDSKILKKIWELLNEADIVITQNGKAFDQKKLYARFIVHGFKPPKSVKHIDTRVIASKHFGFTSNKLEYMTNKLCKKYKKLKHSKFEGFELWKECLSGNLAAWKEMEKYNKHDVLALEELSSKLIPWDSSINFSLYESGFSDLCACGGDEFAKNGYSYTSIGKFQRYECKACGAEYRSRQNILSKKQKKSMKIRTSRS